MAKKTAVEKALEKKVSRREFLRYAAAGIGSTALGIYGYRHLVLRKTSGTGSHTYRDAPEKPGRWAREAMHYKKAGSNVRCLLCPHQCLLSKGDRGICRTRANIGGKLYTLAYGNPCAVHVDPIEKKPLFHFLPKSGAFSIATAGCNLRCLNCQNWTISQAEPEETKNQELMPEDVVAAAKKNRCASIAYTYSEPIVFYEYVHETQKLAKEKGIKNVFVSAGYIEEQPLRELAKGMDAANIDLKSFSDEIYQELNSGSLEPVLRTLKILKEEGVWLEITNLVVPSWTDDLGMIRKMCAWLKKNGMEDFPLHFSRFHPMYRLVHLAPTPASTLKKAREIALEEGLKFVYIGNLPGSNAEDTYCPSCKALLIKRRGYSIVNKGLKDGRCSSCNEKIPGVWR